MALKLSVADTQFGIPAPQAYARITNIFGNKDQVQVQVAIYFDETARQLNKQTVQEQAHYFGMEELKGDFVPAIYAALKNLPQYEGAEDC